MENISTVFRRKAVRRFALVPQGLSAGVVRRPSQSETVVYLENGLTQHHQFYMDVLTELFYIHTEYDVINYFRSEIFTKKLSKMPHMTASGGIFQERFKSASQNLTRLLGTIDPTNLPDMTSLAVSGQLQNAFKSAQKCVKQLQLNNSE